jgi:hypothetical protein
MPSQRQQNKERKEISRGTTTTVFGASIRATKLPQALEWLPTAVPHVRKRIVILVEKKEKQIGERA